MDKKMFGIKISTYLKALGCVALAIVVWVMVKMQLADTSAEAAIHLLNI